MRAEGTGPDLFCMFLQLLQDTEVLAAQGLERDNE